MIGRDRIYRYYELRMGEKDEMIESLEKELE
jgi:hypothetical protein